MAAGCRDLFYYFNSSLSRAREHFGLILVSDFFENNFQKKCLMCLDGWFPWRWTPRQPIKTHPHMYTTTTTKNQEYQQGNFTDDNNKTNDEYSAVEEKPDDEAHKQHKAETTYSNGENSPYGHKMNIGYGHKPSTSMPHSWFLSLICLLLLIHFRKLRFLPVPR